MSEYPAGVQATTRKLCARSKKHGLRPVLAGTDLCGPCHALFPRVLADLINVWPDLQESVMRRPARVYTDMPSGGGELKDASSYWNPAATMVIADVTEWYSYVGRHIGEHRPAPADLVIPAAPFIGPLNRHATVKAREMVSRSVFTWSLDGTEEVRLGLAALVKWHHRWLTHYPTIGAALLEDALRFQWAIQQALQVVPMLRITLPGSYCQVIMEETALGQRLCEGQLVGVIRHQEDGPTAIMCSNHPEHAIPVSDWILLDVTS